MTKRQLDPILQQSLTSSGVKGALELYERDRDGAIAWYQQQGFPSHDPESEIGRRVLKTLALKASKQGVWREAWAGYHLVLAAGVLGRSAQDVAELCFELGRAQVGRQAYQAASVYLSCANMLAKKHPSPGFLLHVMAERGVLALLSGSDREFDAVMADLVKNHQSAEQVAAMTFEEGIKNARWADEQGHHFPETLKLANAQLRMSLELNRRLNVPQAVGVALCELGDVHDYMGKREEARRLYEESLRVLTPLGNTAECSAIRERMRSL